MLEQTGNLSVTQLVQGISNSLQEAFPSVSVQGEVASFTCASSGHWYFTLKDKTAQVKAVMFRDKAVRVGFFPQIGDEIEVVAKPGVYAARGDLQIICEGLKKSGQGSLHEQYLRLKAKLQAEGLFSADHKKPLPSYVFQVGVVTSAQAAAWADIQTAFARRCPHIRVVLHPSSVQGAPATQLLVQAISDADQAGHDLLIVGRGGGSLEDLWCFNEEAVVRAVFSCKTPVIVGVGHESDVTLAEFAADVRAATPTAAAELCSEPTAAVLERIDSLWHTLEVRAARFMEQQEQQVDRAEMGLVTPEDRIGRASDQLIALWRQIHASLSQRIQWNGREMAQLATGLRKMTQTRFEGDASTLNQLTQRLPLLANRGLNAHSQLLLQQERLLAACSPERNLEKGYAFLQHGEADNPQLLKSSAQVKPGDSVRATLSDGQIDLKVTGK
ncbi:MAG: exodeoxyribonuclease VII large subunit [Limnobacter sp.]|nr:exodeoxyribonuclease VII large subunit [Limnobacter sp.]